MTADSDFDTIVIGAGLVGAACALRLAEGGRQVLLLDAQAPGQGASFGNAGHVATEQVFPLASPEVIRASWRYLFADDSPLRLRIPYLLPLLPWMARFVWAARPQAFARGVAGLMALQQTALTDLTELMRHAGIGHLLHADGYLRAWESLAGEQAAKSDAARLQPYGIHTAVVGEDFLRRVAPGLTNGVRGAVFYPGTAHVDDPLAVSRGLVDALVRAGGQVRQQRVLAIQQSSDYAVTLDIAQGGPLRCRQVLVCAGAWSRPLAAGLGYPVPLDTERGYHITVPWAGPARRGAVPGDVLMPVASTERKVIMTPMSMGLRMTGTLEFGGLHLPPDVRRYDLLRRQLQALVPAVESAGATNWMGFRPSMPDHLPVLGRASRHANVFFAFGHQHLGLTLCGVTARVMSELMLGGTTSLDLSAYRVDRF
ncbi:MAG: FAD-binding oxidoreductase [Burkholderiaceae bacterium]